MNAEKRNSKPSRIRKRINFSRTYGLRPRTEIRRPSYECDLDEKEVIIERKPTRGRNRNALMTKYRRKTANERERHRMKEINDAFTTLRGILPVVYTKRSSQVTMTKIRILKLAANYIEALSDLLTDDERALKENSVNKINDHDSCTSCVVSQVTNSIVDSQKMQNSVMQKDDKQSAPFSNCLTDGKNTKLKSSDENVELIVNNCDCDIFSLLGDVAAIEGNVNKWEIGGSIDELCLSFS